MNLHRVEGKSGWQKVPAGERNVWQRLAARTHGWLTPANVLTLSGVGLVTVGLGFVTAGKYWLGLGLVALGRLADIADGMVAEATGTKSQLGESLDAVADKTAAFLTFLVFLVTGVAPWWLMLALALLYYVTTMVSLRARKRGAHLHPSLSGKVGTAVTWLALLGFVLKLATHGVVADWFKVAAYGLAFVAILLSVHALLEYSTADREAA